MKNLVIIFLLSILLSACRTTSYNLNGVSYKTPDEALVAAKALNEEYLAAVTETDTPTNFTVKVVIPSATLTKQKAINKSEFSTAEDINYIEQTVYLGQRLIADALQKRGIFNSVSMERSDTPHLASASGEDYLLWLQYIENDQPAGWYLKSTESGKTVPVLVDYTKVGVESIFSSLKGVETALAKLN